MGIKLSYLEDLDFFLEIWLYSVWKMVKTESTRKNAYFFLFSVSIWKNSIDDLINEAFLISFK